MRCLALVLMAALSGCGYARTSKDHPLVFASSMRSVEMAARRACVDYYGCTPTWDKTSHRVTAKVRTAFAGKSNVTIEMSQLDQERVSVAVISDGIGLDAGWCGRCSRDVNEITNRMTAILSLEE